MNDTKRNSRHAVPQQSMFQPITRIVFATRAAVLVQEMDRSIDRQSLRYFPATLQQQRLYKCNLQLIHGLRIINCKRCIIKYSSAASKFQQRRTGVEGPTSKQKLQLLKPISWQNSAFRIRRRSANLWTCFVHSNRVDFGEYLFGINCCIAQCYRVFLLSPLRAVKLYRTKRQHPLRHSLRATVLRTIKIKPMQLHDFRLHRSVDVFYTEWVGNVTSF